MNQELAGRWLLVLAVAAFVLLLLPVGLHSDDVAIIAEAAEGSYGDAWTSTFLDRFYRPGTVTLVKLSLDVFGHVALPMRVLQGALIVASLLTLVNMFGRDREVSAFAWTAGGVFLLGSPCTFVSITPFAVGVGDMIVGLMFLLAVKACLVDVAFRRRTPAHLIAYTVVALLAKESGVLVAAFCTLECARRRRWGPAAVLVLLAAAYLVVRGTVVESRTYSFPTGFLLEHYSVEELRAKFGDAPYMLYAYNVLASLSSAVVYVPFNGQFRLRGDDAALFVAFALTSFVVGRYLIQERRWRTHASLLAVIVLNACLGYNYVRPRVMFVAHIAVAFLFLLATDDLWRRPQRCLGTSGRTLAVVALVIWVLVLVRSLIRLQMQAVT